MFLVVTAQPVHSAYKGSIWSKVLDEVRSARGLDDYGQSVSIIAKLASDFSNRVTSIALANSLAPNFFLFKHFFPLKIVNHLLLY